MINTMINERELARRVVDDEEQEQESKEEGVLQEEKGQDTSTSRVARLRELTTRISTMINSAYSMIESDELDLANDAYRSAASLFSEAKSLSGTIPKTELPAIIRMSLVAQIPQRMAALRRKLDEDQQPQSKRARSSTSTSTSSSTPTQPQTLQIRKLCASSSNPASVWENLKTIYNGLREAGVEIEVAKPFSKKTLCEALAEHFKIPSEEMEIAATLSEDTLSDPDKWPSQYYDATARSVMVNPWEVDIEQSDSKRFVNGTTDNIEWIVKRKKMPDTREEVKYTKPSPQATAELEEYSLRTFGIDLSAHAGANKHVNFIFENWKPTTTKHFESIAISLLAVLLDFKTKLSRAGFNPLSVEPYIKYHIQILYEVLSPPQSKPPSITRMQVFMMRTYELFEKIFTFAKASGLDPGIYDWIKQALRKIESGSYLIIPSSLKETKSFFFQYVKDHRKPPPEQPAPSQDQIERFMYEDFLRDFESLKQWMLERLEGSGRGTGTGNSTRVDLQTPSNRRIHAIVDNTPVELEIRTLDDLIAYIRDIIRNFTEFNVRRVRPSSARDFDISGLNVSNPALVNCILWIEELKKMIQIANQIRHEGLTQILDRITTLPSYIDIMTLASPPAPPPPPAPVSGPDPLRVLDAAIRDEFLSRVRIQTEALLDRVEDALMADQTLPNLPVTYRTSDITGRPVETLAGLIPYLRAIMNRFETLTTLPNPDIMRAHRIEVQDPTKLIALSWILEMGEVVSLMRTTARDSNARALLFLLEDMHERILGMDSVADAYRVLVT
jgi:hypothetical protein